MMKIGIIGSGVFAKAITTILARKDYNSIVMWTHDETFLKQTEQLQGWYYEDKFFSLPKNITITLNIKDLAENCDVLFCLVSSSYIENIVHDLSTFKMKAKFLFLGSKGMRQNSPYFYTSYIKKHLPISNVSFFCGPNLANDLFLDTFCSMTFSNSRRNSQKLIQILFGKEVILSYVKNANLLEFASTLKNIYAIGSGMIQELTNSKSALHTFLAMSFQEMNLILTKIFSEKILPYDILGDFYLTCTMQESRNLNYGRSFVKKDDKIFLAQNTVEGVQNLNAVHTYLKSKKMQFPILHAILMIVKKEKDIPFLKETILK